MTRTVNLKMRVIGLVGLIVLPACGIYQPAIKRESKLSRLDPGQTSAQVTEILGSPDRVRAAGQRQDGQYVKVWEYEIYGNYRALANGLLCPITLFLSCFWEGNFGSPYWMQFVNGKLVSWGKAGDWQVDKIQQDITIHNAPAH
jgi:hypothetical protein